MAFRSSANSCPKGELSMAAVEKRCVVGVFEMTREQREVAVVVVVVGGDGCVVVGGDGCVVVIVVVVGEDGCEDDL